MQEAENSAREINIEYLLNLGGPSSDTALPNEFPLLNNEFLTHDQVNLQLQSIANTSSLHNPQTETNQTANPSTTNQLSELQLAELQLNNSNNETYIPELGTLSNLGLNLQLVDLPSVSANADELLITQQIQRQAAHDISANADDILISQQIQRQTVQDMATNADDIRISQEIRRQTDQEITANGDGLLLSQRVQNGVPSTIPLQLTETQTHIGSTNLVSSFSPSISGLALGSESLVSSRGGNNIEVIRSNKRIKRSNEGGQACRWSEPEVKALLAGVLRYGEQWSKILSSAGSEKFNQRNSVALARKFKRIKANLHEVNWDSLGIDRPKYFETVMKCTKARKTSLDAVSKRKERVYWSETETNALHAAVRVYGKGKWSMIKRSTGSVFARRSVVDLKDKWRLEEKKNKNLSTNSMLFLSCALNSCHGSFIVCLPRGVSYTF
eukprot:snap_masked-scaffold_68-processed-gene-0.80-mRNA-1 protein AED:1.00 eAED:1.00 QI:0/0/0/0/1/1/2/0/441